MAAIGLKRPSRVEKINLSPFPSLFLVPFSPEQPVMRVGSRSCSSFLSANGLSRSEES